MLLDNTGILTLRVADQNDVDVTFLWANNPKVRAFSFNQNEIVFDDHQKWFLNKVNSQECYYFLFERDKIAIGSIRFDLKFDEAIISYLIDPNYFGCGFGSALLERGIEQLIDLKDNRISKVVGFVIETNIPSIKAFEKLDFKKISIDDNSFKFFKVIR